MRTEQPIVFAWKILKRMRVLFAVKTSHAISSRLVNAIKLTNSNNHPTMNALADDQRAHIHVVAVLAVLNIQKTALKKAKERHILDIAMEKANKPAMPSEELLYSPASRGNRVEIRNRTDTTRRYNKHRAASKKGKGKGGVRQKKGKQRVGLATIALFMQHRRVVMTLEAWPLLEMDLEGCRLKTFPAADEHVQLYVRIHGVHTLHPDSKLVFDVHAVEPGTWRVALGVQRMDVMADGTEQCVPFNGKLLYMKKYVA